MATTYQSLMDRLREQNKHIIAAQQPKAPASVVPVNPAPQPTTSAPDWLGRPQNSRIAEQQNELMAMRNDYSNLFEGDPAVTGLINNTFMGIGDRLNQGGQLANDIGNEYITGIDKDLQDYMSLFGPEGVARGDLDTMLNSQQAALDAERARMDTIYNLENEGVAANAAASGATGGAVAAERARLRGEEASRRADYANRVAELATTKKTALLDMYDKVSKYKDLYRANYANSRDKYALDAYNQITEAQTNLLSQIKNFELQEKQMLANAASASQLAGAVGGRANPVAPVNVNNLSAPTPVAGGTANIAPVVQAGSPLLVNTQRQYTGGDFAGGLGIPQEAQPLYNTPVIQSNPQLALQQAIQQDPSLVQRFQNFARANPGLTAGMVMGAFGPIGLVLGASLGYAFDKITQ